jgi:hypothetical protein
MRRITKRDKHIHYLKIGFFVRQIPYGYKTWLFMQPNRVGLKKASNCHYSHLNLFISCLLNSHVLIHFA